MKGALHVSWRKRVMQLEPFPARTPWKRLLDRVVLTVGIIGPFAALPQILKIYTLHNATGVSALSWGLWALLDVPWILYGSVHKEPPIMITYSLWFVANTLVFLGAMTYGTGL